MMKLFIPFLFLSFLSSAQSIFDAARQGDTAVMEACYLIQPDTINAVNEHGFSPLILAAYRNQFAAVRWLLERGANINQASPEGIALHGACFKGNLEISRLLLEGNSDIDALGGRGATPLIYAVMSGNVELVQLLLDKGADRSIIDDAGFTAKDYAIQSRNAELVGLF